MSRPLAAALLSALTLAAVPAIADAKTLSGKTSQGHRVTLRLGADGVPTRFTIRWTGPCKHSSLKARSNTPFIPPFDEATTDTLRDDDSRVDHFSGRLRVRNSAHLRGTRSGESWSGTFSLTRVFTKKGRYFDTCSIKGVKWSVS